MQHQNSKLIPGSSNSASADYQRDSRLPYQKPLLHSLGDLHSLTLGFSGGTGDSGNQFVEKPTP